MSSKAILLLLICFLFVQKNVAQTPVLVEKDLSYHMRIPDINQLSSSILHVYALSEQEGLIVFRSHKDSLQWLFTLDDVSERGNTLQSDIRFAYLYGGSSKIHIIEPTNLLGIYSVADLGFETSDVARVNEFLFIVGQNNQFGTLNLISPDSVVNSFKLWDNSEINIGQVKQVESYDQSLLVLSKTNDLFVVDRKDNKWSLTFKMRVNANIESLFLRNKTIYGSSYKGELYTINPSDSTTNLIGVGNTFITSLEPWNGFLITRAENGIVYLFEKGNFVELNKKSDSGNFFTVSKGNLWITEYNDFYRLKWLSEPQNNLKLDSSLEVDWKLEPIGDLTLPFPKPMIIHVFTNPSDLKQHLIYTLKSPFNTISQVENNFYWQPSARDIGTHFFTLMASDTYGRTDSSIFKVDVKAFNMPPRFAPFRAVTVPVNEAYSIRFQAQDPDSPYKDLIRYVGLDLPTSAKLNEKTGEFTWTPNLEQVGKVQFRIIATDQFGTSASLDVEMNVLDVKRSGN